MLVFPIAGTEWELLGLGGGDKYSHSFTHQLGCLNAQRYTLPPRHMPSPCTHAQGAMLLAPRDVAGTSWTSPNLERGTAWSSAGPTGHNWDCSLGVTERQIWVRYKKELL